MIAALFVLALGARYCPPPVQTPPHNVVVIVLDDVGTTERSALTVLDYIAANGVTMTQHYSWPVCSPTRYAALTGRYPRRAGIGDVINAHNSATGASPAPNRIDVMLPEAFKPTHSTALVGKWHLGRASVGNRDDLLNSTESGPFVSGFDYWLAGNPNSIAQPNNISDGYYDWYRVDNERVRTNHTAYATFEQTSEFQTWWSSTSGQKFAWLAFNAAHAPYDLPPGGTDQPTTRGDYLEVVEYLNGAIDTAFSVINWSDTYVVVFGDNGTPDDASVGPTGFWKGTTYQGGIRVPFLITGPGISQGVTSSRVVSSLDLGPTLMELVGIESRGFEDGRSFADELGAWDGSTPRTWTFAERYDTPGGGGQVENYDDMAFVEAPTTYPGTSIDVQLKRRIVDPEGDGTFVDLIYDLLADPYEIAPVPYAGVHATIRARFDSYLASLPAR